MLLDLAAGDPNWQEALRLVRREKPLREILVLVRDEDTNHENARLSYSLGTDYWVPKCNDLSEVIRVLRGDQNNWLRSRQLGTGRELRL